MPLFAIGLRTQCEACQRGFRKYRKVNALLPCLRKYRAAKLHSPLPFLKTHVYLSQTDFHCFVNFDGASEDYHFTIMNKEDCEKAMNLFEQLTADIDGYSYKAFFITDDFEG